MDRLYLNLSLLLALAIVAVAPDKAFARRKGTGNIKYSSSGQALDICVPSGPVRKTALIFIHGGGWRTGNKEQMRGYCELFAKGGFVSATINYRLSPANKFPAALEDTQAAIRWMKQRAGEYGNDPDKLVLVGYSAGGNLALMAGLASHSGIAGIVSGAGPTDLRALLTGTPFPQLKTDLHNYLGGASPDAASPIHLVGGNDPPVFLFHGDKDPLVPVNQSVLLAERLKAKRSPVLLRVFPGAGHEIMLPNRYSRQLLEELTRFLLSLERN